VIGVLIFGALWLAIAVAELAAFAIGFWPFLHAQPELVLTEREILDPKVHFLFPEHEPSHGSLHSAEAQ
jgi:hypothetical protein